MYERNLRRNKIALEIKEQLLLIYILGTYGSPHRKWQETESIQIVRFIYIYFCHTCCLDLANC